MGGERTTVPPSQWVGRDAPPRVRHQLEQAGVPPLLAQVYAARGIRSAEELDEKLQHLLPPQQLLHADDAGRMLADAIAGDRRVCVVADYDCDGATACAVALRGLRLLGMPADRLQYLVPDRTVHGYGLSPTIVDLAIERGGDRPPHLLLTVDNGIASVEGVAHAQARGLQVLVTDHHLAAAELPGAEVIVNPNQPACPFPSKNLAGVGVMFYVLMALRSELRSRGAFDGRDQPRLDTLLDLVALGTVADVVKLDANNRRLVAQGLDRIRHGRMQPGVAALFAVAGREPVKASAQDFGFALGPRINAAGRLSDMTLGIECLVTDDPGRAADLARALDAINRERRQVEDGMRQQAQAQLDQLSLHTPQADSDDAPAMALFDESFHEGVVGIVAGRLKDRLHRPVFVFARGHDGQLKGSGRSIEGFHLRDALDWISKREPNLLLRFGGHAMAAGCTLAADGVERFRAALQAVARLWLDSATLQRRIAHDGALPPADFNVHTAQLLASKVWGQGFEAPQFCEPMAVLAQRTVGERHLKLRLRPLYEPGAAPREAIWFQREAPVGDAIDVVYRLEVNEWQGRQQVQMVVVDGRNRASH